ncbi:MULTISPECIES: PilZ domain-containing protein [Vibrio]|uniref:PilZ domain-containing protein n=1 Tax=Vibrio TaxID=662 RepID=UPI002075BD35|nr:MULTISPECIES: PilZ domain-containing protein [Vibrio]USD34229.1 flagellar brake protein [Vibrio sp. SCSIO 43186]USD47300.1 flagellar brake protein [Vibrio sp. SCSIO 43145]USD71353.1 flagellar brake protein [Vibrio sp. SCSIO 43139]USD98263.1 pilus assembly protein PilZ [Vibrio coralliilyticus]
MHSVNDTASELIKLLAPGMRLSATIEFGPEDLQPFSTSYIGCKTNQFLIIDLPQKARESLVMRKLTNVAIIIRGITNTKLGHIVAFKTSIISQVSSPGALIFLRIPQHFASKAIREHERYALNVPIEVKSNTVSYNAVMVDFSVSGCAFFIPGESELSKASIIKLDTPLSEWLPDDIKYSIVGIQKENKGHRFGIKFNEEIVLSDELKQALLEQSALSTLF